MLTLLAFSLLNILQSGRDCVGAVWFSCHKEIQGPGRWRKPFGFFKRLFITDTSYLLFLLCVPNVSGNTSMIKFHLLSYCEQVLM